MPRITWKTFNKTTDVPEGTTLLDAAIDHEIPLEHACGGFCACTTCRVEVVEGDGNVSPMEDMEIERLERAAGASPKARLGCQTKVLGDVVVDVPPS